uniref:Uncharacterized protein n=1 Tax=viral metagenome TaxID=1070528 RepID=A0A6M3JNM1_9ZZZZ
MGKKKLDEHLFLVPDNKEGTEFIRVARKFLVKPFQVRTFLFGREHGSIKVFIGCEKLSLLKRILKKKTPLWLSSSLLDFLNDYCNSIAKAKIINLIHELQKEFKTDGPDESAAVKQIMEKLLASYVAGIMKGKYDD